MAVVWPLFLTRRFDFTGQVKPSSRAMTNGRSNSTCAPCARKRQASSSSNERLLQIGPQESGAFSKKEASKLSIGQITSCSCVAMASARRGTRAIGGALMWVNLRATPRGVVALRKLVVAALKALAPQHDING